MSDRLQQAGAWGKVFAVLAASQKLTPAKVDMALQNPKAALADALRGKYPADDTALAEAVNQIDAGVDLAPMNNDEQGQFWIGFYQARTELAGPRKKPGPPKAKDRVDWQAVDWGKGTTELARLLGVTPSTVSTQRKRYAPKS